MLERILLKHLTKKGKIAYFVGLVVSFALVAFYLFGIAGYTSKTGKELFFFSIVVVNIVWAGITYAIWKKEGE